MAILNSNIQDVRYTTIDPGVFDLQLVRFSKHYGSNNDEAPGGNIPRPTPKGRFFSAPQRSAAGEPPAEADPEYEQAQAILTENYRRVVQHFRSRFDVYGIEPSLPHDADLLAKQNSYRFSQYRADGTGLAGVGHYPPHLKKIEQPKDNISLEENIPLEYIFNNFGLIETDRIIHLNIPRWHDRFVNFLLGGWHGRLRHEAILNSTTMQEVEEHNKNHRKSGTDIQQGENIGLREDWYSDRRFAEQSFTGTNPTTITKAKKEWVWSFLEEAKRQRKNKEIDPDKDKNLQGWIEFLSSTDSNFFVQDCSYFRTAVGAGQLDDLVNQENDSERNWACASVTLFQLVGAQLHPVAIVLDYKGTMEASVTIFNQHRTPRAPIGDPGRLEAERNDWPWRYAKTCAQVSDWIRHEAGVHLTRAHFVEEVIIVATHLQIPMGHIVYQLLNPHWYKTLSLNAAARSTLVPDVIKDLVGFTPAQLYSFVRHEFNNFHYTDSYVPRDLELRGFSDIILQQENEEAPEKYRNYVYAKNILALWECIQKYVEGVLLAHYGTRNKANYEIENDPHIKNWCEDIRGAGHISSFPLIKTFDDLRDAITMSIHIASPFHTAVNYLQNYYQAFIPSKPPALLKELPKNLKELEECTEQHLVESLPIHSLRQSMLSVQLPWLLSFQVEEDRNLLTFARSQWQAYSGNNTEYEGIREATRHFFDRLIDLAGEFDRNEASMDPDYIPYRVLNPETTAVSILI